MSAAKEPLGFQQALAVTLIRVWVLIAFLEVTSLVLSFALSWPFQHVSWGGGDDQAARATRDYYLASGVSAAVGLCIAAATWILAPRLASVATARSGDNGNLREIDYAPLVSAGVFLVGLWFLLESLPKAAVLSLTFLAEQSKLENLNRSASYYQFTELAGAWIMTALAAIVALRAGDVGKLFAWLREAGLRKPEAE